MTDVWWDTPSEDIAEILPELLSIPGVVNEPNFDYILLAKLGDGMCGSVVKCQNTKTGELVAIKCIGAAILDKSPESRQKVIREIRITSTLSAVHKGIIGLSKIFVHDDRIFIAMEIAEGGDLFEVVMTKDRGLDEKTALQLFHQMVEAVSFLHEHGISHRDIKPENFLLTAKNEVKLCDFGFCANFFKEDEDSDDEDASHLPFSTPCGSSTYLAPEILLGQRYTHAVDVWSLGVSLYTMLSGLDPWGSPAKARERILKGDFKPLSHISPEANDLLRFMIQPDPAKRPTVKEILAVPIVARADKVEGGKDLLVGVSPKMTPRTGRRAGGVPVSVL